ncbi:MAG: methylmalonyl Co-A mutase-associated GTPase MeaB [Firmicutes bacterium HGW-Firmicutes-12]|nr:MAG: methylmalonyl Co-A mutase-associated GTPase MeaB [Firmicutes bacterium HGW-Firmicutes-12]
MELEKLIERFWQKDRQALSKLITIVENNSPYMLDVMKAVYPMTGKAHILGVTGPPGAGKSTLVDKLIKAFRNEGHKVGVLCVDPSSIYSGGAFLGDRIRMQWAYEDDDVYLRSMATRGELGGLAPRASEIIKIMDAFGKDVVIVETVGVGQMEADIIRYADTKVVVSVPGLGDQMQALKGGILEIADVFVVNKADTNGALEVVDDLKMMLHLRKESDWKPEIVLTEALNNKGTTELYQAIQTHKNYLNESGTAALMSQTRREHTCLYAMKETIKKYIDHKMEIEEAKLIQKKVREGGLNPYQGANEIINNILKINIREGE